MMYVDNEKFFNALVERKAQVAAALEAGNPKPRVSEYIGKCIYDICTHLYFKPGFIKLQIYRDEMISDAMENCIRYVDNFDPKKSTHPFAYFTQIAYYAYLRRIGRERRYFMTKQRALLEMPEATFSIQDQDSGEGFNEDYVNRVRALQQVTDYDKSMEVKPKVPKIKKLGPIELLMKGDDEADNA